MISAILLAAGQSKRMNGENKLVKKFKGIPLIKHSVKNILNSSVDELIIVLGYEKEIIEKIIEKNNKIKLVFNKNFKNGMSSSIKTGLNFLSKESQSFFVCLGDMPLVNFNIYNQLIKYQKKNNIVIPTYNGEQRNPVLFSISMKEKIMHVNGDLGAKKILEFNNDKLLNVEIDDLNFFKDFNTVKNFNLENI